MSASVTRTISTAVIVIELTQQLKLFFPVLVSEEKIRWSAEQIWPVSCLDLNLGRYERWQVIERGYLRHFDSSTRFARNASLHFVQYVSLVTNPEKFKELIYYTCSSYNKRAMDVMRTELKTLSLSSTFNDVINLLNNSLLTSFPLIDGMLNTTDTQMK